MSTEKDWEDEIAKARALADETPEEEQMKDDVSQDSQPEENKESVPFDQIEVSAEEIEKVLSDAPEEKKDLIVDIPNFSEFSLYTTEDLDVLSEKLNNNVDLPEEELSAILNDETEHITKLSKIIVNNTKRQESEKKCIERHKDNLTFLPDILSDKMSSGKEFDKKNKNITGDEASVNFAARINGLRKIHLFNSGFHIITKKLSASEIRDILRYIDEEEKELGRILGAHYYTIDDIVIVQRMSEIMKDIVVDSNLVNWKQELLNSVNYLDFDNIIGSLAVHLFRNGVQHEMVCPELTCKYSELQTLDITKTKLIDMSKLSEKALNILLSPKPFDVIKYKAYQKEIGAHKEIKVRDNTYFTLKVPTINTFVQHGIDYISKLIKALYSNRRTPSQAELIEYRVINYYKMFLPWIEKASIYNEDGSLDISTTDVATFEQLLEKDVWVGNKNIKEFIDFFTDSKIVHYGFLGQECPVCHKVPNPKTNGFVPLDIRSFFFNLLAFQNQKDLKP